MTTKKEFRRTQKTNSSIRQSAKFRFLELLGRFERTLSVLGRSQSTFNNYSRTRRVGVLHFGKIHRIGFRANSRLPFTLEKIKITFTVVF